MQEQEHDGKGAQNYAIRSWRTPAVRPVGANSPTSRSGFAKILIRLLPRRKPRHLLPQLAHGRLQFGNVSLNRAEAR